GVEHLGMEGHGRREELGRDHPLRASLKGLMNEPLGLLQVRGNVAHLGLHLYCCDSKCSFRHKPGSLDRSYSVSLTCCVKDQRLAIVLSDYFDWSYTLFVHRIRPRTPGRNEAWIAGEGAMTACYEHIVVGDDGVAIVAESRMKVAQLAAEVMAYGWSAEEL